MRIARNQNGPASSLKNREKFLIQSAVTTIPRKFIFYTPTTSTSPGSVQDLRSDQLWIFTVLLTTPIPVCKWFRSKNEFLFAYHLNNLDEFWNAKSAKEELLRTQAIHRLDLIIPMKVIRNGTRAKSFTNPSSEEASTLNEQVTFASFADKGNEFFYDATDDNVDKSIPNAALVMEHDDSPIFISNKAEQVTNLSKVTHIDPKTSKGTVFNGKSYFSRKN